MQGAGDGTSGQQAEELFQSVWDSWQPSRGGFQGSMFRPGAQQWLDLARWLELLGRSEDDEFARFVGHYVGKNEADGESGWIYRNPGQVFSEEYPAIEEAELRNALGHPKQREFYSSLLLPSDFSWKGGSLAGQISPEAALLMAEDPRKLREFFAVLSPADFTPGVLQNLDRLHRHRPEDWSKHFSLALALAVVFDQAGPPAWPHHQVDRKSLPLDQSSLEQRFDFWVKSINEKNLSSLPGELGADLWKYVVDALVSPEELEWARKNVRTARGQFHRTFSSIKYDMARLKTAAYSWPHPEQYSLANIQQLGGICVDQAYFAAIAGKAQGLPTLYFSGQGADGGHAWFGYLKASNRWDLEAGRYENQNYAVGHALDPQTWQPISDHELQFVSSRARVSPAFQAALADLILADWQEKQGRLEEATRAVESALAAAPQNPEAWEIKGRFLAAQGAAPADIAAHWEKARKTFPNNRDLQTRFQTLQASSLRDQGNAQAARQLEQRVISQNQRQRSDLSVEAAARQIQDLIQAGDLKTAETEFRRHCQRLGRTGGGNFFYDVTRPLVRAMAQAGQTREARRIIEQTRKSLQPENDSILDRELLELEAELGN